MRWSREPGRQAPSLTNGVTVKVHHRDFHRDNHGPTTRKLGFGTGPFQESIARTGDLVFGLRP